MSRHSIIRDGVQLSGVETGEGPTVIFQHGLGGDEAQVAEVFPDGAGFRRLTLECRGQGQSALGCAPQLSITTFASDVLAFADALGTDRFVVGGISMGAAIALRLAVTVPTRVRGLILNRPAWLWGAAPANMRPFAEVAALLSQNTSEAALAAFDASDTARRFAAEAPDNLASLRGFFARPDAKATAQLLGAIAADGPGVELPQIQALTVPTLVIGNVRDAVHPLAYARTLAAEIPAARFVEVTAKADDRARHAADVRAAIAEFLISLPTDGGPT